MSKATIKQKLKDLRTKLANLDIEIRALLSKGEMEPGMIDAVTADIDEFTSQITATKKEIEALSATNESISLSGLYNEVKTELGEESSTGGEGYLSKKAFKKTT